MGLNFGRWMVEELSEGAGARCCELAAVCDVDREKAGRMGAEWGVKAYGELEEVLRDDSIPAIGLFTGPVGRAGLLRRCLAAGKDVMTTKPLELDPEAALAVLREARAAGRVIHLNSPAPLPSGSLRRIEAWRREHDLGRPVAARAETWVSYREAADGKWYDDPDRCPVAPLFRLGIYMINDLVRLLGEPETVQVVHSRLFTGRPTPDNAQLMLRFKNGALAGVFASFGVCDGNPYADALTLNFENGTIYRNVGLRGSREKGETRMMLSVGQGQWQKGLESRVVLEGEGDGRYQWETFCRAVRGERIEGEIMPEQIVSGLRVIRAMRRAELSGAAEAV